MKNLKSLIFGLLALISIVVVRCLQIVLLTNPENGFFYDRCEGIGSLLTATVIVIVAAAALLCFFSKNTDINLIPSKNTALGIAALLAGAAQISEPFSQSTALQNIPSALTFLRTVFILCSGFYFCYLGILTILGVKPKYSFSAIPVIAWILRLVVTFISFTGMSNISDNLYDVLTLGAITVFLLLQGKVFCKIEVKSASSYIYTSAMVAVLFTAVAIIPRFVVAVSGTEEYSHLQVDSTLSLFFTAVYIAVYLIVINKKAKAK